jgi:hypothetical protein
MSFLQRWNFIARARLERQLWDAFERGDDLDAQVAAAPEGFEREVLQTALQRIRRLEALMQNQNQPKPPGSDD